MLKRIPVAHLKLGMFIEELCGSWMEHPFWRTSFLLDDDEDVRRLVESGIHEVWIDTSRGLDISEHPELVVDEATRDKEVTHELNRAAATPAARRVSMDQEIEHATRICARSKEAVASMFAEARMGKAVQTEGAMALVEQISDSLLRNPGALISLARLKTKDDYTYMHSVAVSALMIALARQLGLPEAQTHQAGLAGLLHDLGKAMMPPEILNKPGKLTDVEFDVIRSHPVEGHQLLVEAGGACDVVLDVCLHHHEKTDGTGYPHRLNGDEISLFAKMGAVCDVYDAITSNRPYKAGWNPSESIRRMVEWSKGHFDETVFHAFVRTVGIYPIGSLVRLESGRLGVVTDQGENSLLTPCVRVFFSTRSNAHIAPSLIHLSHNDCHDRIVATEDPGRWKFKNLDDLWKNL